MTDAIKVKQTARISAVLAAKIEPHYSRTRPEVKSSPKSHSFI